MKFNAAKCHSKRVIKHSPLKHLTHGYSLYDQIFENVSSAKYLRNKVKDMTLTGISILITSQVMQPKQVAYTETCFGT